MSCPTNHSLYVKNRCFRPSGGGPSTKKKRHGVDSCTATHLLSPVASLSWLPDIVGNSDDPVFILLLPKYLPSNLCHHCQPLLSLPPNLHYGGMWPYALNHNSSTTLTLNHILKRALLESHKLREAPLIIFFKYLELFT